MQYSVGPWELVCGLCLIVYLVVVQPYSPVLRAHSVVPLCGRAYFRELVLVSFIEVLFSHSSLWYSRIYSIDAVVGDTNESVEVLQLCQLLLGNDVIDSIILGCGVILFDYFVFVQIQIVKILILALDH